MFEEKLSWWWRVALCLFPSISAVVARKVPLSAFVIIAPRPLRLDSHRFKKSTHYFYKTNGEVVEDVIDSSSSDSNDDEKSELRIEIDNINEVKNEKSWLSARTMGSLFLKQEDSKLDMFGRQLVVSGDSNDSKIWDQHHNTIPPPSSDKKSFSFAQYVIDWEEAEIVPSTEPIAKETPRRETSGIQRSSMVSFDLILYQYVRRVFLMCCLPFTCL